MNFAVVKKFPAAEEILEHLPLTPALQLVKAKRDEEIRQVVEGKDNRFLVIIGPCSAHDEKAVLDYCTRLAEMQEKLKKHLILIPRVYTNKPRTTGEGYKGMLHQPDPNRPPDLLAGLLAIRSMHLHVIEQTGLTSADEMLYPENLPYFGDLLSYIAIGARSVENQQHRLVASGINIPVGMKNPTSGDFNVMFNSIQAAQSSHDFIFHGDEVATPSNPLAHAILRGSTTKHGDWNPNYHYEDILRAISKYEERHFKNPTIIIDTNHDNSGKRYEQQPRIAREILSNRQFDAKVRQYVKGLMIESYIEPGRQEVSGDVYGKSITDPCMGWSETEELLYYIAEYA